MKEPNEILDDMSAMTDKMQMSVPHFDALEHWVNNPLIKPHNKVERLARWEEMVCDEAIQAERNRVLDILIDGLPDGMYSNGWVHSIIQKIEGEE